ncbi:MAG: PQQ-like beta-propeller repeat protein [Proteobacteria bacterium]|nr:PQQ-like beta-propeller repeat protein [Pseudomonadota bacterium]
MPNDESNKKHKTCSGKVYAAIILGCILLLAIPGGAKDKRNGPMNQTTIINGMPYANSSQNASLPVSVNISGKDVWTISPPSRMNLGDPRMLAVKDQTLFVFCQGGAYAVDIAAGKVLWGKAFISYADPFINDQYLRIVDANHFLAHIDLNGNSIERFRIPILVKMFRLFYMSLSDDRMFLFLNRYPARFDKPQPQGFILTNYARKNDDIEWYKEHDGELAAGFAVVPDTGDLFVATPKQVYKTTTSAKTDSALETLNITGARSLSMDYQGNLLIMRINDKDKNKKEVLLCAGADGKKKWDTPLSEFGQIVHPAACSSDNVVYCSPDKMLYCIKDGNILWQKDMRRLEEYGLMLTVFSDGSVIVAGINSVRHFSQKGDTLAEILAPFEVTCRPVADDKGNLFVAGMEGVRCYK